MLIETQNVTTRKPDTRAVDAERPTCFGGGVFADSGQRVPLAECRPCPHVVGCSLLRVARHLDQPGKPQSRFNSWEDGYAAFAGRRRAS